MHKRSVQDDEAHCSQKRPRVLIACKRCKSRRQKCDNASPACSNCAGANAECVFAEKAYPSSYVKMLEERVASLEGRSEAMTNPPNLTHNTGSNTYNEGSISGSNSSSQPNRLALGFGVLSSCAASEPHYFGFSAGLSLAHFMQIAMESGQHSGSQVSLPILADKPFSSQLPTAQTPLANLPTYSTGRQYIKAYLTTTHRLYPFLDKAGLLILHREQTMSHVESHNHNASKLDLVLLHLVYAIGSRCLQLIDVTQIPKDLPEGHFMSAMKYIPDAIRFTSIRSIEIVLLLVLHSMRSPSGGSVWHLSGLAIRQCLELGLHKQRTVNPPQLFADQLRKRMFWSSFILERKTALVLGRPFSVSETEVDVELPLDMNDDEDDPGILEAARASNGLEPSTLYSSLSLHRYHILVYQIHTKIRQTVQSLKNINLCDNLAADIAARFRELDGWKGEFLAALAKTADTRHFSSASDVDSEESTSEHDSSNPDTALRGLERERIELLLEYHKARRSLLQPLMTERLDRYSFQASDFAACATSSGQICQLYRKLNRLSAIPFTLRDLQAVFVAGFTLIYCICLRPSLHSIECASDIGACSAVLHAIAGQWTSAKRYRDAFETVAEVVLERARGDGSFDKAAAPTYLQENLRYDVPHNRVVIGVEIHNDTLPTSIPHSSRSLPVHNGHNNQSQESEGTNPTSLENVVHNHQAHLSHYDSSFLETMLPMDLQLGSELGDLGGLLLNEGMDWFTSLVA